VPFARPTLKELTLRVSADLRAGLSIAGPLLRRAMADVIAAVWAGAVHMLHGHLEWLGKQLFPDTSERDFLLRQASLYGIYPAPATYAAGSVIATGTDGTVIPADTILTVDGKTYRVITGGTIASGSATLPVKANVAGADGNVPTGVSLAFESPIPGVNSAATVAGPDGISGGFDEEETEGVRDRLLMRLREPPEGGADHDYVAWALAVGGVTRAWVYPNENGLGTVVVRFVCDEQAGSIFPDAATVSAVQDKLDAERPITAEVTALAPTPYPVNFSIHLVPDTTETRAAVTGELTDLLYRAGAPADGTSLGTIKISQIRTAIGVAEGVTDYTLSAPTADVVPPIGGLATMGAMTWL
jgi:uncharacterized phage protein gp47/JayE